MINFIVSILLGLIPEVLYFTLFLVYCKNLKEKRLKLFGLLSLGYIALIMICRYQLLFYVAYVLYSYLILKWVYKSHILDLFVCSIGLGYMTIVAFIGYIVLGSNYLVYYIVARVLLYLIFIFRNKFNKVYKFYRECWNRNSDNKIKSLTLRNLSIVFLNLMIILFHICAILCAIASLKYL